MELIRYKHIQYTHTHTHAHTQHTYTHIHTYTHTTHKHTHSCMYARTHTSTHTTHRHPHRNDIKKPGVPGLKKLIYFGVPEDSAFILSKSHFN